MEKIILVDGNNLLFRSYYATAYNGNFMKNSKGFPTNALFGFSNMINKIILEEKPTYMIVAFDKGKTFRHEEYTEYKGGRMETPDELKMQFPLAKQLLTYLGITYYEIDNYEADDIIGTFAEYCNKDEQYEGLIVSSDKDLLQLISDDVEIKLLKQKDYIRYNKESFKEEYGIDPIHVIDLKALMGDASDHIPGVKGIGEKTALKLLHQFGTLDGIYENLDKVTSNIHTKLTTDKENAYMSYHLATIVKDVPLEINIEDIRYRKKDHEKLNALYEELEFYSFLKKEQVEEKKEEKIEYTIIRDIKEINIEEESAVYLETLGTNYHTAKILGMAVYNKNNHYYIPFDVLKQNSSFLQTISKSVYDKKKIEVALRHQGIEIKNIIFDTMIASYLLDYNMKEDIAYLASIFHYDIPFYDSVFGKSKLKEPEEDVVAHLAVSKAKFIYETKELFENKIKEEDLTYLFEEIEMKLATVLGDMEYTGITVNKETLIDMGQVLAQRIEEISKEIYALAGEEFNIASPKQLGEILFEKMGLPVEKKNSKSHSTASDVLHKLIDVHPIAQKIIDFRMVSKIKSTYVDGLLNAILEDGKIHTIYTQTLTRTGRLSSIEPNLQNIPMRYEEGKQIRKAFVPSENSVIISSDYSQIELRILASMANVDALIEAFKEGKDIHTKTAADIFHVSLEDVEKHMRRIAKAVNFGIIYGISSYGLSENVGISPKEAKEFINTYFATYPGIKEYMDSVIQEAYKNGYVKTLMNRKRIIPELANKNYMIRSSGERMALNTPIQGTSADIIKKAMIEIYEAFKENGLQSKMVLQVHDELIFDVKKEEAEKVSQMIEEVMENTYTLEVPLKVELEYGDNWYDVK
ncbi:MAG: DNA polymerase I [Bacilli bacterium]|nr:DNA polymerase I [Bacilli bacterium]